MSQYRGNSSGAFRKLPQPSFNRRPPQAEHHQRPLKNVVRRSSSSTNPSIGSIGGGLERFSKNPSDSFVDMEPQNFHSLVDEMDVDGEEQWENMRKWVAACVVAYATHVIFLVSLIRGPNYVDELTSMEGDYERQSLMRRLVKLNDVDCHDQLRMNKDAFANLVYILKGRGLIRDTIHSSVEEQVARFLYIVGHNLRNRKVKFAFRRSGETVSRQFKCVLRAIISLEDLFLKQPDGKECPAEIKKNCKYYPYFKDCVGAIDGSHFRVKVSSSDAPRYRGRKSDPTQNVLAACTFDLKFTYVLSGWEGSASDSRILKDALSRAHDRLIVPQGKYYLVDAGFQLKTGFLAPYRSTRYHLKEYSIHEPQNSLELFNLRHASLRNSIERAFGVLKKKFPMLRNFCFGPGGSFLFGCRLNNEIRANAEIYSKANSAHDEISIGGK